MYNLEIPLKKDTHRKIIHIDMDAFFASVEERENPALKEVPLVIARNPKDTGGKGVVTTANYKAREFGIHSAMPAQKAYELCPKAVFKAPQMELYREVSKEVFEIFKRYTDIIEQASVDEAYLDVTENKIQSKSAILIAKYIQRDIYQELNLTCSAGISYNKFLAKLGSDFHKPKGMTVILPEEAEAFLKALPIEKFHGIGKKTIPKLNEMGVFKGEDLYRFSEWDLISKFGKMGYSLYRKVRGVHDDPVQPHRDRKSIGRENTYGKPLFLEDEVISQLRSLSEAVMTSLKKHQKHGKVVTVKIRYSDFSTLTKRLTLPHYVKDTEELFYHSQQLFFEVADLSQGIRLLGVTVSSLDPLSYENILLPLQY